MRKYLQYLLILLPVIAFTLSSCSKSGNEVVGPGRTENGAALLKKGGGKPPEDPPPPADPAIAFVVHASKNDKLMVMDSDGSNQTEVYRVEGTTDLTNPSWSPDGQSIAFIQAPFELWRIDVEVVDGEPRGSNAYPLLEDATSPEWSPAGDEILFVSCCGFGNMLQVVDALGGTPRTLYTASPESRISCAAWSPNASTVAFVEAEPEAASIKILNVVSGEVTTVLGSLALGNMTRLDWARIRTEHELAFGTAGELHTVDIASGVRTFVTEGSTPSWSPDDNQLVFMTLRHQIATYNTLTGKTETLARSGWYPDWRRF